MNIDIAFYLGIETNIELRNAKCRNDSNRKNYLFTFPVSALSASISLVLALVDGAVVDGAASCDCDLERSLAELLRRRPASPLFSILVVDPLLNKL